jgi:hypothetical protein
MQWQGREKEIRHTIEGRKTELFLYPSCLDVANKVVIKKEA